MKDTRYNRTRMVSNGWGINMVNMESKNRYQISFLVLVLFPDSYACSTAKSETSPMKRFFIKLKVQSIGLHHPGPPVIENWYQFQKQESI